MRTKEEAILIFDEARKLYSGSKKGLKTEYSNFVWRSKHPIAGKPKFVIAEVLPLLKPAIDQQIIWRKADGRYWKNFQTWINQRCWEEEVARPENAATPHTPLQATPCAFGHKVADGGYLLNNQGKPLCVCKDCRRALRKMGITEWDRPLGELEKLVEKGKRRPPPERKDPEESTQKKVSEQVRKLSEGMKA